MSTITLRKSLITKSEDGHVGQNYSTIGSADSTGRQNYSTIGSADSTGRTAGNVNFAKIPLNFGEINPQSMDGNSAKQPPVFVNVKFTKYPLNFNEINMHSTDGNLLMLIL